jgi:hypothetical protein
LASLTQLNKQLWTGGAILTVADVQQLVNLGITADIDCRLENDQPLLDKYADMPSTPAALILHPAIRYCYDGVPDDGHPKPVSWFQTAWDFGYPLLTQGGVLLAHCTDGVNRGPSMAYFFLRAYWGMPPTPAYDLIKELRPIVKAPYRDDADEALVALGINASHVKN